MVQAVSVFEIIVKMNSYTWVGMEEGFIRMYP